jgi:hypothetical protein
MLASQLLAFGTLAADNHANARSERGVVATVGDRQIGIEELGDVQISKTADATPEQLARLAAVIRAEVIEQELTERGIEPSKSEVDRQAAILAEGQWRKLGATDERREQTLYRVRAKMEKLRQGLALWREDEAAGDDFARRELAPLGIGESLWTYYKSKADSAAFLEELDRACGYDKRGMLEDLVPAARRVLEMRSLRAAVVGDVRVSRSETERLFTLTQRTDLLELTIIPGDKDYLRQLRKVMAGEGGPRAGETTYPTVRLSSSDLNVEEGSPYRRLLFLVAIHCHSLEPHTVSEIVDMGRGQAGRYALIHILARVQAARTRAEGNGGRERLARELEEFKRRSGLEVWLSRRIRQKTTIHDDRFGGVESLLWGNDGGSETENRPAKDSIGT